MTHAYTRLTFLARAAPLALLVQPAAAQSIGHVALANATPRPRRKRLPLRSMPPMPAATSSSPPAAAKSVRRMCRSRSASSATNNSPHVAISGSIRFSFNPRNTNIRGLGSNVALTNDGLENGVGVYIDDVYYGRVGQSQFDLVDLDRVEVLRGPQGRLFGKNTTAGAINISSKLPKFDLGFEGQADLDNYDSSNSAHSGSRGRKRSA